MARSTIRRSDRPVGKIGSRGLGVRAQLGLARLVAAAVAAGLRPGRRLTLEERVAAFPRRLPVAAPLDIYWDRHAVPYVKAEEDRDLPVALGAIHAHLRLSQIEFLRLIAYGRLSEAVGGLAAEIDHLLRLLDVGRAAPEIEAMLPAASHEWLAGFAEGLNAVIAEGRRPLELALLDWEPHPWTVRDLLVASRLVSTDFTWKVWLRLLPLTRQSAWAEMWQRLVGSDALSVPSMAGGGSDAAEWLLDSLSRPGSNCFALDGARSGSGAPLLASDPHLPIVLPNLWLIAGFSAPSYRAVGLMIPGVPAVGLGRSPWGAWGGTSLHAASSDLFDVSSLCGDEIEEEDIEVARRWSTPRRFKLRRTRYGPIVSDAARVGADPKRPLALTWVGHRPSDELTALLGVLRARSWEDFAQAMEGFALPAQNMLFAEAEGGRIGQLMAAHLPKRPIATPGDLVTPLEGLADWDELVSARDLPMHLAPKSGFLASANDAPQESRFLVSHFFSSNERIERLRSLLGGRRRLGLTEVRAIQNDVVVPSAPKLRDALLRAFADAAPGRASLEAPLLEALRQWDGAYRAESSGALAFELIAYHLVTALHGTEMAALYLATWDALALLKQDLERCEPARLSAALSRALVRARPAFAQLATWGGAHRLRPSHPLGHLPLVGRRFRSAEMPVGGSSETLMKTAAGFSGGRHQVRFGANARFIADLGDPNENHFLLLGGQDGWIESHGFDDQVTLWRRQEMIRVPLEPEMARRDCRVAVKVRPRGEGEA